jgi:hypothetical protein
MAWLHAILLNCVDADDYKPFGFSPDGWELFVYDRGMSLTHKRVERWRWLKRRVSA